MRIKIERARSYWAAEKRRDLEAILSHFTDTAVFRSPTMSLAGRSAIAAYYEGVLDSFSDVDVTVVDYVESTDTLAVEWDCRLVGSDNRTRRVLGCNVFRFAGEMFSGLNVYFNAPDFD